MRVPRPTFTISEPDDAESDSGGQAQQHPAASTTSLSEKERYSHDVASSDDQQPLLFRQLHQHSSESSLHRAVGLWREGDDRPYQHQHGHLHGGAPSSSTDDDAAGVGVADSLFARINSLLGGHLATIPSFRRFAPGYQPLDTSSCPSPALSSTSSQLRPLVLPTSTRRRKAAFPGATAPARRLFCRLVLLAPLLLLCFLLGGWWALKRYDGASSSTAAVSNQQYTNSRVSLDSLLINVPDIQPLDVSALNTTERVAKIKEIFGHVPATTVKGSTQFNVNDPFKNAATSGPGRDPQPKDEDYLPDWYPSSPEEEELQEVESYRWIMEDEECLEEWIGKGTVCSKMDSSLKRSAAASASAPPIDIVFTWVNGSDPLHQQARKYWLYCLTIHTEARDRFCPQGYDKTTGKLAIESGEALQKKMDDWLANAYPLVQYQEKLPVSRTRPANWHGGVTDASIGVVDRRF